MEGFSCSVIGASHLKCNKEKQDFADVFVGDNFIISTSCDGHGGAKYHRSAQGAKFASSIAIETLSYVAEHYLSYEDIIQKFNNGFFDNIKYTLLAKWQEKVKKDIAENPLLDTEINNIATEYAISKNIFWDNIPEDKKQKIVDEYVKQLLVEYQEQPEKLYGTTMLASLMTQYYIFSIQIGDGLTVIVKNENDERIHRIVLPTQESREVAQNEPHGPTDSLCSRDAFSKLTYYIEAKSKGCSIITCTDGLSEGVKNDNEYFSIIDSIIQIYIEEGKEEAKNQTNNLIQRLTTQRSPHDDVSIAFITDDVNGLQIMKKDE